MAIKSRNKKIYYEPSFDGNLDLPEEERVGLYFDKFTVDEMLAIQKKQAEIAKMQVDADDEHEVFDDAETEGEDRPLADPEVGFVSWEMVSNTVASKTYAWKNVELNEEPKVTGEEVVELGTAYVELFGEVFQKVLADSAGVPVEQVQTEKNSDEDSEPDSPVSSTIVPSALPLEDTEKEIVEIGM